MITLNLYTTAACHLCEQAEALLLCLPQRELQQIKVQAIDIADSDTLVAQYGIRIPVLQRNDTLHELNWPFSLRDIQQLIDC